MSSCGFSLSEFTDVEIIRSGRNLDVVLIAVEFGELLGSNSHGNSMTHSIAILLYDYALTFGREVELFWKRPRLSWPFLFFMANRYITVIDSFFGVAYAFAPPMPNNVCRPWHFFIGH